MKPIRVMIIFGTRPEAIKMSPLIKCLRQDTRFDTRIVVTAQHRQMLDQVLQFFNIKPENDLDVMQKGQSLTHITAEVLKKLEDVIKDWQPDIALVHGDTTTTFAASLAAFYQKVAIGHVEAGLRTFNKYAPYPEELNRKLTGCLADLHFAPTACAKDNLIKEGVRAKAIYVTGNTIIDVLLQTVSHNPSFHDKSLSSFYKTDKKKLLLTSHRRENIGKPLDDILTAVRELASRRSDVQILFPVHLNMQIRSKAFQILSGIDNVRLSEPLRYEDFVNSMAKSDFILTDSGGVQEEGVALSKPVLVLRNTTERPEALNIGASKVIGTTKDVIIREVNRLLDDKEEYQRMAEAPNPFGDGKASQRIAQIILSYFND